MSGGRPRYYFQAPSLFGLEHYGTSRERRRMGCAWGQITHDGIVRVRPLTRVLKGDTPFFVDDPSFAGKSKSGFIQIAPFSPVTPIAVDTADLAGYLEDLQAETGFIKISGIGSGTGKSKTALSYPIENLYTTLRSHVTIGDVEEEKDQKESIRRGETTVALRDILPHHRRFFIEGQPGAGKTTFLKLVASCLARDGLGIECPEGMPWRKHYLGLEGDSPPIPIFLRVADLVPLLIANSRPGCRDDRFWFIELLEARNKNSTGFSGRDYWIDQLVHGRALLLVDGLDESGDEHIRERVLDILHDTCAHWGESRIVVSSRPIQARCLEEMGFHRTVIEPFGEEEINRFIDQWIAALYENDSRDTPGKEGGEYRNSLLSAIVGMQPIKRIATNPVMLTCLCVVHWNEGRLPEGRARVYRAVIRWLIASRTDQRNEAGFTDRFAVRAFFCLALHMMETAGKQATIGLQEAAEAIEPVLAREYPELTKAERQAKGRQWLAFETEWSGVVEEIAGRRMQFFNLSFQEYFCSRQLVLLGDGEDSNADWWPIVKKHLEDRQWTETIDMVPVCLFDDGGETRVDRLFHRILELRGPKPNLAKDARIIALIDRLISVISPYYYKFDPHIMASYGSTRERILSIFDKENARVIPLKTRLSAVEALGRGGDPRLFPWQKQLIDLPFASGIRLSKYPVTVDMYREFIEDGGYSVSQFWDNAGWTLRQKNDWNSPGDWGDQLEFPNRPVANVSWYEASAFCRWLKDRYKEQARLPTADEWFDCSKPNEGEYPWGTATPTEEYANFSNRIGKPTPVGLFPAGAGPYGHFDLSGNVWEWCSPPTDELAKDKIESVPIKGGSWADTIDCLRVSAVNFEKPSTRSSRLGFRVLIQPSSGTPSLSKEVEQFFEHSGYEILKRESERLIVREKRHHQATYSNRLVVRIFKNTPQLLSTSQTYENASPIYRPESADGSKLYPLFLVAPEIPNEIRTAAVLHEQGKNIRLVPITFEWMRSVSRRNENRQELSRLITTFVEREEPFNYSKAVDSPGEFFGRHAYARDISLKLKRGQSIGLFGLRKIGKTSLFMHIIKEIPAITIWIDCQAHAKPVKMLKRLPDEFRASVEKIFPNLDVTSFTQPSNDDDLASDIHDYLRNLHSECRKYSPETSTPFVLFLDEIDRVVASARKSRDDLLGFERLFGTIRSLSQGPDPILVSAVAGAFTDITVLDNELGSGPAGNPVYNFFHTYWLLPMTNDELFEMMNGLGSRVALKFTDESIHKIHEWTGGHPFLARILGSVINLKRDEFKLTENKQESGTSYIIDGRITDRAAEVALSDSDFREQLQKSLEKYEHSVARLILRQLSNEFGTWTDLETLVEITSNRKETSSFLGQFEKLGLVKSKDRQYQIYAKLLTGLIK